jgi:hypothetical protein
MDFMGTANAPAGKRHDPLRRLRRCAIFARVGWSDFLHNTYLL